MGFVRAMEVTAARSGQTEFACSLGVGHVWLAHLVKGTVTRFDVPGIQAFNFVCTQALDGGGMASMRNDPLGKGMAQILLSMPIRVPPDLLGHLSATAR